MTDNSPFLRLPDVTMNHILYFCDYLEIARLRNFCRSLRNHIDVNKPDAHVQVVSLGDREDADICFESDTSSRLWIDYSEAGDGCTVTRKFHTGSTPLRIVSGLDPMDALKQDFKIYLRHLKTPLRNFKLHEFGCDPLLQVLSTQTPPFKLRTAKLQLTLLSSAQIVAVLPFFDSNCLKSLKIITREPLGEFHELFESEHWRNAERIHTSKIFKIFNVRQIAHLKEFTGSKSRVTAADVESLKNTFIRSALFKRCIITVDVNIDLLSLIEIFGAPSIEIIEHVALWFFHISNDTNRVLLVKVSLKAILEIKRINRMYVPSGAVIIH